MKVRSTKDYDKFKTIEGNRDVIKAHVKKVTAALSKENLNNYMPILVNSKMEVIDGQHRLEALRELGMPVNYIVIDGADLATVQMLNSSAKSWSLNDYVQSFIKRGNENYMILDDFRRRYNLPLMVCVTLLTGSNSRKGPEVVRDGSFEVKSQSQAEAIATYISEMKKYVDPLVLRDRDFLSAYIKTIKSNVNRKQLVHKLKLFGFSLKRQISVTDYQRELERVYNFRSKGDKVRLF